jgi:Fe-S oxidoreductase
MAAKIEAPQMREYPVVPMLKPDAMKGTGPYIASKPEHQTDLGFPETLVDNWEEKAVAKMGELLDKYRSLRVYLDSCVRCGACTDKCHYFIGTNDPKNMPVARQDLLRSVYRYYYTPVGKFFAKAGWQKGLDIINARPMTKDVLDEWYNYFHQCSQCRRCSVFCPYGIDTADISMAAREIMDSVGQGQKYCNEIISKVYKIGNNLGLPEPALRDTLEGLEEDVEDDTGVAVRYPLDEEGAEVLVITPSADFFAEPHVDGLMGYGKVFHQAGISWTLSSFASEGANFGMFIGSYENMHKIAMRIREAALDLKVKRIVVGECGHAWRVAYSFWNTLAGIGHGAGADDKYAKMLQKQLDPRYPAPQHICEFTYDLLQRGALKIDKSANDDRVVTFHDSCNVARASRMGNMPGGQFIIPREVIKAVCNNFYDMNPATIHDLTFCCGGGGGLLTDDLMELRVKGALPRMEALREAIEEHGVTHMAAICAICKSQFTKVLPYYGFSMDQIVSVHQLVSDAIVLNG